MCGRWKRPRARRLDDRYLVAHAGQHAGPGWKSRLASAMAGSLPRAFICRRHHGDRSPAPRVLEMLRQPDFFAGSTTTIFPILNPEGLSHAPRAATTPASTLNRDYRGARSTEIRRPPRRSPIARPLRHRHDAPRDYEGTGAYL